MKSSSEELNSYINTLCTNVKSEYTIDNDELMNIGIKKGLRNEDGTGVLAGITRIGSVQGYYVEDAKRVPMPGKLYYRGIDVEDIVAAHQAEKTFGYEEVAYLLLLGKLPNTQQYNNFRTIISHVQPLPDRFIEDIIMGTPSGNVMNILSRCVLSLYPYDEAPEDNSIENLMRQSIELIARFPVIVATAYSVKQHRFNGKSLHIHNPKESLSVAENFLRMLRPDKAFSKEEALLFDLMLILHAEHGGGNNSTFTCRVLSSTRTDTYSAIAGAINSLKGPLHGGANAKVVDMLNGLRKDVPDTRDENAIRAYLTRVLNREAGDLSGKIYGLGHAVYTLSDPRAELIKKYARSMAEIEGRLGDFQFIETVERIGLELLGLYKKQTISTCANVDLYSGLIYDILGISEELYTPIFALARIAGWCAHRIEEVITCNSIIRPAYRASVNKVPYVSIAGR